MSNYIDIVEYKDEYRDCCIDLLEKTFNSEGKEAFEWRFETKRHRKPIIVCAIDNDKVVSFNSWIPWEFQYKDKVFVGYQSGESATDVNYRRKGIFEKVLRKADDIFKEKDINFLFGFPGSTSVGAFSKVGYYPIGLFNFYIRLLSPFRNKDIKVNEIENDDVTDYLGLVDRCKITPVFNNEYVKWRYVQNPNNYRFIIYNEDNNKALFIARENKHEMRHLKFNELFLVDCQFSSFNSLFTKNAMKYLSQIYAGRARQIRTFFNPNCDRSRALGEQFHFKLPSHENLIIKPINSELGCSSFLNYCNWDILPHVKDAY